MKPVIIRRTHNTSYGTFGVLSHGVMPPSCVTLEREWLDNLKGVSCIPAGTYICKRHQSPKYDEVFWVQDVPGRTEILIHWGNIDDNSRGCILLGESFEPVLGSQGIVSSKDAFNEFMRALAGEDQFRLIIVDDWKNPIN